MLHIVFSIRTVFFANYTVFLQDLRLFSSYTMSFQVVEIVFMLHIVFSCGTVFLLVIQCFYKILSCFQVGQ